MKKLLPILLILILPFILFLPYFNPPEGKMIYGGDIYDAYYFWKGYLRESFLSGTIPFWNPYNFSGTPFLAHPNINIFYPLNWIYILFSQSQSFAIYMFLHMVIAGITMYWLGRQYTDRYGALFCAISYSLGSFFSARLYAGHPEYMDTAAWMPLAFGLGKRVIVDHKKKSILFAILSIGLLFLSGNELFILYTLELLGLYILFLFFTSLRWRWGTLIKNFGLLIVIAIFSLGITALEVLPRLEFLRLSLRSEGVPYGVASSGSMPYEGFKLFVNPFIFGLPESYNGPWPNLSEYVYYVGILPLTLVLFVIFRFKKQKLSKDVWFFLVLVVPLFFIISLGINSPINLHEILWKYIPFYSSYRFPVRHMFVVFFSLSLVSGIILGSIKYRFIKIIFIVVLMVDLLLVDRHFFRLADIPTKTFDQQLVKKISYGKDFYRVLPDFTVISAVRRDIDFGASSMYRFYSTSDYNSMILSRYYRFIDLSNGSSYPSTQYFNVEIPPPQPDSPYIDFLNVKYVTVDKSADAIGGNTENYNLVSEGDRYRLYENKSYLPRFFLVSQAMVYPNLKELEEAILARKVDLGKTIHTPNKIVLTTNSSCGRFLSSSEIYYPGWLATIDGRNVPVYRSNYAFRSIYVPKGEHEIEFYYYPRIYIYGLIISILSGLGLYIIWRKIKF
ncbi:YfhO family protein [Candidatus Gottesmanbacteria bacterium]|nr:YfhO family protein [Candidatus Gottesmanbacteria bacterium]